MPKVTIIMNCYNGEKYLEQAIDSIFAQTFDDWEFIFWDNCSTDNSASIAKSYGPRVRYFCAEETTSLGAARALAVEEAKGDWIGFLDSDDYWYADKLEKQINALKEDDYVLCYAGVREITERGKTIRVMIPAYSSGMTFPNQLHQFDINMVTPLINRNFMVENNLNFNPKITASVEYSLFMRLAARGKFCIIHEPLGVWRIWPGTLTSQRQHILAEERRIILEQVIQENPGIAEKYPHQFAEAFARGDYFEANYFVKKGSVQEAKVIMKRIKHHDIRYKLLYLSLWVPGLWNLMHSNFVKLTVATKLLNFVRWLRGSK